MRHLDDDETPTIAYRDLMTLLMVAMLLIVIVAVPFLAPVSKSNSQAGVTDSLVFEISWPGASHYDVDLWLLPPRGSAVGFDNKNGDDCNLIRDDTGTDDAPLGVRYEMAVCRDIPDGEYLANAVLYSNRENEALPVKVKWAARNRAAVIAKGEVPIGAVSQEVTLVRFVTESGIVKAASISSIFASVKGDGK